MRIGLYLNILDEEYQISVYRGIRASAEELGISIVCVQDETLRQAIDSAQEAFPLPQYLAVDGILLLTSVIVDHDDPAFMSGIKRIFPDIPLVSIGNRLPGIPSILIQGRESMLKLMDHLIMAHGYRNFLYLGGPGMHHENIEREEAFREAVRPGKGKPDLRGTIINTRFTQREAESAVRDLIANLDAEPLDAIVAASDNMASGVLKALRESGDRRWQSCAVTGFDDIPRAALEVPALTTVHQPFDRAGRIAVQTLRDMIEGRAPAETVIIEAELVIRSSCGCPEPDPRGTPAPRETFERLQTQKARSERLLREVTIFGQRLSTAASMGEIYPPLRAFLDEIGARAFYLALFPDGTTGVPDRCTPAYAYTEEGERLFGENEAEIRLKDFFSLACDEGKETSASRSLFQLAAGVEIPGVIVYEVDDDALPHLCSSAIFIANTIKRLRILDTEKEHSRMLEREVALRTRDLSDTNRKLEEEAERRKEVEAEVLRIGELERLRFSLDLHDDICQRLAGISMFCKSLSSTSGVEELSEMIDETLSRTRQYAHDSFPVELDALGLRDALENLCHATERQTGCECVFTWEAPGTSPLGQARDINVYRIAQEAIANAVRHSRAKRVAVAVTLSNGVFAVRIEDNGRGNPELEKEKDALGSSGDRRRGLGLRSMRYRARQIGASYRIKSSGETGTSIEIGIPLENSPKVEKKQ